MQIEIVGGPKKYSLMGTFEVGNSGHYEQRILVSNLSLKKAQEALVRYKHQHQTGQVIPLGEVLRHL